MLIALLVVIAGTLMGFFVPFWLATTLSILFLLPIIFIFIQKELGYYHVRFAFYPLITLWILLFGPMWLVYFLTNCKVGG
jgi:hypothetical protein